MAIRFNVKRKMRNLERLQTVYVMFAGAIYGAALAIPLNYYVDPLNVGAVNTLLTNYPFVIVYLIIMIPAGPLILSFFFTLRHPEKRIVPPMLIHLVGISIFITDVVLHSRDFNLTFGVLYFSLLSILPLGAYLDQLIVLLLGRLVKPEDLKTSRLKVYADQQRIVNFIQNQARGTLHLHDRPLENTGESVIFKTVRDVRFTTYVEVCKTNDDGQSILNVIFFEKGDYSTVDSDDLKEYQREKTAYLFRALIDRPNDIFSENFGGQGTELMSRINDDLLGVYQRTKKLTQVEKIRLIAYGLSPIPLGVYIGLVGWDITSYGAIIATLISAVTDISRIFIKNRRTPEKDE